MYRVTITFENDEGSYTRSHVSATAHADGSRLSLYLRSGLVKHYTEWKSYSVTKL